MSLSVSGVGVSMRGRVVLSDVSFHAARGELVILAGPNGAGKTTLLKAIARLIAASGSVSWEGADLHAMSAAERARILAYLPQGHVAHWPITVRDAVAIGRAPAASSLTRLKDIDRKAIEAALAATDTAQFADRPITALSGGERARVMLARALAADAPLLLADEPVASLDPAHQLAVMELLARTAYAGRLVIAVIHDLTLAGRFADRVLLMNDGRLVADGAASEVLTPEQVARVFHVESVRVAAAGGDVLLPWTPSR
jgi:iron complex transport system ATP-binding protein